MLILRWAFHSLAAKYYATMLARGCPYPEIGAAWIWHDTQARSLDRRIAA